MGNFGRGWRTLAINLITLAVLLLTALTGQLTDPAILRGVAIGLTVANVLLRFLTDTKVGSST